MSAADKEFQLHRFEFYLICFILDISLNQFEYEGKQDSEDEVKQWFNNLWVRMKSIKYVQDSRTLSPL